MSLWVHKVVVKVLSQKIISFCTWVEKSVATSQSLSEYQENKTYFKEHLEAFHKIKGYFNCDSYIHYKSDVVDIVWEDEECSISWVNKYAYKRSKIAYIPFRTEYGYSS